MGEKTFVSVSKYIWNYVLRFRRVRVRVRCNEFLEVFNTIVFCIIQPTRRKTVDICLHVYSSTPTTFDKVDAGKH